MTRSDNRFEVVLIKDLNDLEKFLTDSEVDYIKGFISRDYDKRFYYENVYGIKLGIHKENQISIIRKDNKILFLVLDNSLLKTDLIKNIEKHRYYSFKDILHLFEDILGEISKEIDRTELDINNLKRYTLENSKIDYNKFIELTDKSETISKNIRVLWDSHSILFREFSEDKKYRDHIEVFWKDCQAVFDESLELKSKLYRLYEIYIGESQRILNERMEKLTVLSTIFLPATFIASLYGMNFQVDVIPPWNHPNGFFIAGLMIILSSTLTLYFIRYLYNKII